jgi:hypothetical protein
VRRGGTAFEHVHGEHLFDHLARHPDREAAVQASMAVRSEQEAHDVVAAYDFSGLCRIVDVGGGRGVLLATILRAHPSLQEILTDRETAIAAARAHLHALALDDRAECFAADVFDTVPAGADASLSSRVIHDWDDNDAGRILGSCRRAMQAGSRLLIVEAILPERAHDRPAAIRMDLHMIVLLGARERTEAQFRDLLESSGFRVHRVVMTESPGRGGHRGDASLRSRVSPAPRFRGQDVARPMGEPQRPVAVVGGLCCSWAPASPGWARRMSSRVETCLERWRYRCPTTSRTSS